MIDNKDLKELLESKFPWLTDPDEPADGADTVDTVMEMYAEAGGKLSDPEFCDCGRKWNECQARDDEEEDIHGDR